MQNALSANGMEMNQVTNGPVGIPSILPVKVKTYGNCTKMMEREMADSFVRADPSMTLKLPQKNTT